MYDLDRRASEKETKAAQPSALLAPADPLLESTLRSLRPEIGFEALPVQNDKDCSPVTLAELIAERQAKIDAFETYGRTHAIPDISAVVQAIKATPILTKADAFAALDLILDEAFSGQHLSISMVAALRRYIERTQ